MVTMEFCLHASRLNVFRSFILKMAVELESRLAGHEGTDLMMKRRRTQCHWLLDRTSLCAAVFILHQHRDQPELMLFLLVSLTYGFTNWKNLELAGGIPFLTEIFEDFDEQMIRDKWRGVNFTKKAYNTQQSLQALVLTENWIDGLIRFLKHWRRMVGAEVWQEFYTSPGPSPEHTASVLKTTARIPPFASLLTRRLLGLYDDRLYEETCSFEVGHGAVPVLDWLCGREVDWTNFALYSYEPKFAQSKYPEILENLAQKNARWFKSHLASHLPVWVESTGQLYEGAACEKRKQLCEEHTNHVPVTYKSIGGYRELFCSFENIFVVSGRVLCLEKSVGLTLPAAAIQGMKSQIILKNAKTTPVASELSGVTLQFKGRYFKTLNDFCKTAGHTNPNAKIRKALMDHKFDAKDTLWWAKGCPRNYSRQLARLNMDELCLAADLPPPKRRKIHDTGLVLFAVDKLKAVAAQ